MANETNKNLARRLRQNGQSYSEILKLVNVSKSTLSLWLRDIPLSHEAKTRLEGRSKSRYIGSKSRQHTRINITRQIIEDSKTESINLLQNKLFLSGLMLYWAEGTKRGQELVNFSNSDPNMIKLMMRWFREVCHVKEERFRIQLHIHSLIDQLEIKKYWSNITGIPDNQFHKLIIKKTSLGHRKNILYNGTCCIRVSDKNLFRKIMGWKIGVLSAFNLQDTYTIPQ
jgi:hypothetical protein